MNKEKREQDIKEWAVAVNTEAHESGLGGLDSPAYRYYQLRFMLLLVESLDEIGRQLSRIHS